MKPWQVEIYSNSFYVYKYMAETKHVVIYCQFIWTIPDKTKQRSSYQFEEFCQRLQDWKINIYKFKIHRLCTT